MDRFIVGTGRCGSTLLSRMLATSPAVLGLFEFFTGLDWSKRFTTEPLDGAGFAELITAEQPFVTAVLRRGYEVEEIVYPFDTTGRYRRDDPLPWILVTLLPRLTDDPDSLFDELSAFAAGLPEQPLVDHYHALFGWLAARLDKQVWIERSGSSIEYLASLDEMFPDARFLHIHRDGREVALSMREHHAYRLPIALMYDAPVDDGTPASKLAAIELHAEPTATDTISRILASRPPAEYFGRYWNDQIVRGHTAAAAIDPARWMDVRFEDLVASPPSVIETIAAFFELDDGRWIGEAAGLVRGTPPTRFEGLENGERSRLTDACRPGLELLGRPA